MARSASNSRGPRSSPDAKGVYWDARWGQGTWDKYDEIVDLANEYGLDILARLDTSPPWARPGNPWPATPPTDVTDTATTWPPWSGGTPGACATSSSGTSPTCQRVGEQPVDAAAVAALLAEGYRRAKAANPEAVIVAPAMAPTIEDSPWAQSELAFLEAIYAGGWATSFDVLSVQAYGLRDGPDDRRLGPERVNFSRPLLVRELMVRHGDARKPVWAAELGWNALPPDFAGPAVYGRVSEAQQARYTVRGLQRIQDEWPWLQRSFVWYFKRADPSRRLEAWYYFRLRRARLYAAPRLRCAARLPPRPNCPVRSLGSAALRVRRPGRRHVVGEDNCSARYCAAAGSRMASCLSPMAMGSSCGTGDAGNRFTPTR